MAVLREGLIRFRRKVYCCSSGTGIAVVEGCLLPCTGKMNYGGSILGAKAGRNEGGHWVKRAVYIGSKKNPMLGHQKDPTVGRLTDPQ